MDFSFNSPNKQMTMKEKNQQDSMGYFKNNLEVKKKLRAKPMKFKMLNYIARLEKELDKIKSTL